MIMINNWLRISFKQIITHIIQYVKKLLKKCYIKNNNEFIFYNFMNLMTLNIIVLAINKH